MKLKEITQTGNDSTPLTALASVSLDTLYDRSTIVEERTLKRVEVEGKVDAAPVSAIL
jgi:hypothetical protein